MIGCGQHAQDCQYVILDSLYQQGFGLEIELLVELEAQKNIVSGFIIHTQDLRPKQCFFLPEDDRNSAKAVKKEKTLKICYNINVLEGKV